MPEQKQRRHSDSLSPDLLDGEAGALQIGPTELGMVRLIITTQSGVLELDYPPEEAKEIAQELTAAAELAARSERKTR
ncbi:MAG: DUF6324 family protein [Neomegalonema sp.]|nr:DUF6324 family protein [Neomegalonema sp.]